MENSNFVDTLADHLKMDASVKKVYGDPIEANGKTIIPVARVCFGLGGGYGNKSPKDLENEPLEERAEGTGGGGGLLAKPVGVYEISDETTRFIPSNNTNRLLAAGLTGLLIGRLLFRRKK